MRAGVEEVMRRRQRSFVKVSVVVALALVIALVAPLVISL
jgi:hypothetical protein